jgi:subtilisin family serine protease
MRTLITVIVLVFCLQLWAQVPDTTSVAPGRLILKVNQAFQTINTRSDGIIETEQTWFNTLAIQYQINKLRHLYAGSSLSGLQNKYLICFPDTTDLETVTVSFEQQNQVQNVRYDLVFHLCIDDLLNSFQWNLQRINANESYYNLANTIPTHTPVKIAVVDTGVDYNQIDLTNNILRDGNNNVIGYNVLSPVNDPMDDNGHGTLVAGIIAAQTNNNTGISSLVTGNNVKLMPVKAFSRDNSTANTNTGYLSDICEGISWSLSNGANVINCSWTYYVNNSNGEHYYPDDLVALIDNHLSVLFVAARGNSNTLLPAIWADDKPNVITVGGSNINNTWEYSGDGEGNWISVCAPS